MLGWHWNWAAPPGTRSRVQQAGEASLGMTATSSHAGRGAAQYGQLHCAQML